LFAGREYPPDPKINFLFVIIGADAAMLFPFDSLAFPLDNPSGPLVASYLPPFQARAMKRTPSPERASMTLLKLRASASGDFSAAK
jgi:hypothetical protein